ncbi:hypothetical protein L204_105402 [Cryptococcus depauperatus]
MTKTTRRAGGEPPPQRQFRKTLRDNKNDEKPTDSSSTNPGRENDFFNYCPPFSLLLMELLVLVFFGLVCFSNPNAGLAAVVKSDSEYIGLLSKCSVSSCDGWMAGASSGSAGSGTNPGSRSSTDTPATGSPASRRGVSKRALDSTINLSDFYLTTGLAALACFYMVLYTLLFSIARWFTDPPVDEDIKDTLCCVPRASIKIFIFRTSRIYVFFLTLTAFGVACSASRQVQLASKDGGKFGMAVVFLHISWVLLLICTCLEIFRNSIRKWADTKWISCNCFFPSHRKKAEAKWKPKSDEESGLSASGKEEKPRWGDRTLRETPKQSKETVRRKP